MANKRMFTMLICDSDAFLDMPLSAQALYFHLNMRADDDGFISNPKKIGRMIGSSEDDLKLLLMKRFVLGFENGVIVIKHWRMHNTIQKDRYTPTVYQEQLNRLRLNDNKSYTDNVSTLETVCIQNVSTDIDIDLDKDIDIDLGIDKKTRHRYGQYKNVLLTDEDMLKLQGEFGDYEERIERLSEYIASTGKHYKNHLATIRAWARKDEKPRQTKTDSFMRDLQRLYDNGK